MVARKSRSSRSSNTRSSPNRRSNRGVISAALKNPRKAGRDVMDAATMGLERVGHTLELVADFAQRAGEALNDVGESLKRAAKDVRPSGRSTTHGVTAAHKASTNGGRRTTTRNRRSSTRPISTGSRREPPSMRDESAPFAGVGA